MRDFKNMKRQRSRNRGNGGGKPQQNANRAFESNGPDGVKIRGAAQHVFEKYQQLARDALTAGDRVLAESYQQHAEHYFRVLRAVQPQRPASDIIGRDAFASGFDIDFEDEGAAEAETAGEASEGDAPEAREGRQDNRRDDRPRDDRPRDRNFNRDDRPRDRDRDRNFNRDDRPPREDRFRDDRSRDDRPRDERQRDERSRDERSRDERSRDDRPRDERSRDERPREERFERSRDERRFERGERPERAERADPLAVVEPRATPLTADVESGGSPMLRSHDGGVSHAPAFLQSSQARAEAPAEASAEPAPKPRRRRTPRSEAAQPSEDGTSPNLTPSPEEA